MDKTGNMGFRAEIPFFVLNSFGSLQVLLTRKLFRTCFVPVSSTNVVFKVLFLSQDEILNPHCKI